MVPTGASQFSHERQTMTAMMTASFSHRGFSQGTEALFAPAGWWLRSAANVWDTRRTLPIADLRSIASVRRVASSCAEAAAAVHLRQIWCHRDPFASPTTLISPLESGVAATSAAPGESSRRSKSTQLTGVRSHSERSSSGRELPLSTVKRTINASWGSGVKSTTFSSFRRQTVSAR